MTELVFWGGLILLCVGLIWAIAQVAEATGEARAEREQAQKDAQDAKKAGTVIAENRGPDVTAGKLSDGTF